MQRRPTLKVIADALGLHITTVSKALRGHPHIDPATRERVVREAERVGYVPDPLLSALAAYRTSLRPAKFQAVLAWVHPHPAKEQNELFKIPSYSDYVIGAETRAAQLGYRLEQFWMGDYPAGRFVQILHARGIEGIVIAPYAHERCELRNFPMDRFSAAAIGYTLRWPRINMVTNDHFRTFLDMLRKLDEAGYRRIGFYLDAHHNSRMDERSRSAWLTFSIGRDLPLFIYERFEKEPFLAWFKENQLDAVVVGDRRAHKWLKDSGTRSPEQVGVAHYSLPASEKILSGMYHNCKKSGEAAIDLVASMLQRCERGIPENPYRVMIDSCWLANQTVRARVT